MELPKEITDNCYEVEYLFDHQAKAILSPEVREAKAITHFFETEQARWVVPMKDFKDIQEFAEYYYSIYGIAVELVHQCWMYKRDDVLISYPYDPADADIDEDAPFLGIFYCYLQELS